eukprot:2110331-Pyramimonas_sp.AAC.1
MTLKTCSDNRDRANVRVRQPLPGPQRRVRRLPHKAAGEGGRAESGQRIRRRCRSGAASEGWRNAARIPGGPFHRTFAKRNEGV